MRSKKNKIIIIIICVMVVAGIISVAIAIKSSSPKVIKVQTISEAFDVAKKQGFKGNEKDLEKIITTDNDTKQKGIQKVYVDDDNHLKIVLNNGSIIDVGDANIAIKTVSDKNTDKKTEATNNKAEEKDKKSNETTQKSVYKVVFKDYDSTVLKTENVIVGKSATAPVDPKKDGYIFDGWDKPFSYVNKDLVITAQYKKSTNPTISLSGISAKSGTKTATVDVSIANNPGISSLVLDINYPKALKLKDVDFNQDNLGGAMATTAKPFVNPQRISIINSTKEIKGNGIIATLTFELPKDISADYVGDIIATYNKENVFDIDMNNVQFDIINGKVLISK